MSRLVQVIRTVAIPRSGGALLFLLLVASLSQTRLAKACQFSIATPQAVTAVYDPFGAAPLTIETAIQVKTISGSGRCTSAVSVQNIPSVPAASGNAMRFQILDVNGAVVLDSTRLQNEALLIGQTAPSNATQTVQLSIKVSQGQIVAPGSYATPVVLTPVSASDGKRAPAGPPVTLPVVITVAPSLSVNVVGGGQSTTLDFDILTLGAMRAVSLQARANHRFALIASSDNGGVLRLNPAPDQGDWKVPYTIRLGTGAGLSLSPGKSARLIQQPTSPAGAVTSLEVTVGDPAHQRAGRYKDVITVQVAAEP